MPGVTEPAALTGLAALRARDPSFDIARFLQGARQAFQMIVKAFAAGDRNTLKPLLAPEVMTTFETAMAEREREGRIRAGGIPAGAARRPREPRA